ncbi:MAG: sensor histidine kinase, partial [Bacteroidales bacterium]
VLVNEGFCRITGFTEDEVIGKTSLELNIWVNPEDRERLVSELSRKGKVENFEACFRIKNGTILTGLMSASILEIDGEPHILNVTRDITGLKKIEADLKHEKNLLRTLIDALPDRIYIKDTQSRFIICNKALVKRMGKNEISEIIGKSDLDLLPKELAELYYNKEQEILQTGEPLINHEEPLGMIAGVQRWNLTTKVPLKDASGNIIGLVGIGKDITEIKRKETESQVLYEIIKGVSTTSNLDDLLRIIHDSLKKVVYAENFFIALYDKKTGLFSFPYFRDEFDSPPEPEFMEKSLTKYVFKNVEPYLYEENNFQKLVENNIIEIVGTPSASWVGIPLIVPDGVIGVMVLQHYREKNIYSQQDVKFLFSIGGQIAFAIERKKAEEEIQLKNNMLQRLNEEKDKFFSIIAHDLRGPLSAFLEATRILSEEIMNMSYEEIKELAVNMNKEAESIYFLLENLLEWSRLQRGVLKFEKKQLKLCEIVNNSIFPLLQNAREKEITINLEIPVDVVVHADRHMFETIVRNIVSNAIKFTSRKGYINIYTKQNKQTGQTAVFIKDTGIGIPQDRIDSLFSLSSKFNRPGTEGEPSSGLGLLLCKEFIEKHEGTISVQSEEGTGSLFSIVLPS